MGKYFLFLILILIMTSCASVEYMTINVQKPAQITIPLSVRKIAVVNNAGKQPGDVGHMSIATGNKEEQVSIDSDSLAIILTQALAQFMNDEGFYESVEPYNESLRPDESFLSESQIEASAIKQIADAMDVDAIISLDRLIVQSVQKSNYIGNSLTMESLKADIAARFRIYSHEGVLIAPLVQFTDSLQWEGIKHGRYLLTEEGEGKLPTREAALRESVLYTADQMVKMFIPYWEDQNRWYYTDGNTDMKRASVKASGNDWKSAALIWGELYEKEKSVKKKAKLASNIALANEMIDDVENAVNWAQISFDLFSSTYGNIHNQDETSVNKDLLYTGVYLSELKARLKEFQTLDVQQGSEIDQTDE